MKTKIEIKSIWGSVLFSFETESNSIKKTVEEAARQKADLREADLRGAYLQKAYLQKADLRRAYLRGAYLQGADLREADLEGADLREADLRGAYLREADLRGAYLQGADLRGAYLQGADLRGADLDNIISQRRIVPEEGAFIGYKKLRDELTVKIEIPADAKRVGGVVGRKCRAEFAKIVEIRNDKGHKVKEGKSQYDDDFIYRVGEIVKPDKFDDNWLVECSSGIHFFMSKQEAIEY